MVSGWMRLVLSWLCVCNDKFNNNSTLSTGDEDDVLRHLFAQVMQIFFQSRSFCLIAYFDSHYACHKAGIRSLPQCQKLGGD